MSHFFDCVYAPRWTGDWEAVAGKNGQAFMIYRNPDPQIQNLSPYSFRRGPYRDEVIKLCVEERARRPLP